MRKDKTIAPSILSADFAALSKETEKCTSAGAEMIHVDVMDGCFVPNITIGPPVVASLRKATDAVLDVHLMIEEPDRFAEEFRRCGADIITVHYEACRHLDRTLRLIKACGARAGLALNPATSEALITDLLPEIDMVLVMSVNPGFGGQKFIPYTAGKIRRLYSMRQMMIENGTVSAEDAFDIEVDGGVNAGNASYIASCGADILVAGSAVFNGDPSRNFSSLMDAVS